MRVLIRADASIAIGTGHVMRCLALCQALREGGAFVEWLAREMPDSLRARIEQEGCQVVTSEVARGSSEDADETVAKSPGFDWVVLDGYSFEGSFQERVLGSGMRTILIDDGGCLDDYHATILLNPNLYATEEMYASADVSHVLVGRKYAMLRRDFWEQGERPLGLRTRKVLVTMGGSDPDNVTGKVIRSLKTSSLDHLQIRAIVGASNPYWETLQVQANRAGHPVELLRDVRDMRSQFEWADVCISAAGNTALELACVGVATLFVVIVDNQEPVARAIKKFGFGRVLGWHEDVNEEMYRSALRDLLASSEERDRMSRWGRELVDGKGALRVAEAMREWRIDYR